MTANDNHEYLPNALNTIHSPLATHQIPREHPRLFGSRGQLQALAKARPDAYRRTKEIAGRSLTPMPAETDTTPDFGAHISLHCKLMSMGLVSAIEQDAVVGRAAVDLVIEQLLNKPVRLGHDTFGVDCGEAGMIYDFCHEYWTADERKRYQAYLFECRDRNVDEELSPFHNGWWGYKNAGFILGLLAITHQTDNLLQMLNTIDREYRLIAVDALKLCGDGGGFAEGFYVNYWLYYWLLACQALRVCTGADYLAQAPEFYRQRAIASAFEQYPGIRERGSRRAIGVGDARGRFFKVERDANLTANRMLAAYHAKDPANQAINTFLNQTPHVGADENAYKELLWFDPAIKQGNLKRFRLSHVSPGPGFVYARSSWEEDATYFFFKCGNRFTSHQHLDVGHFFIYKHEELAGEGGQFDRMGGLHGVNYYSRTIAHNSILVHDPAEKFTSLRGYAGNVANDGGQAYPWPGTCFGHNGGTGDGDNWRRHPELGHIADLVAFQDTGAFVYTAGDCTRAYSSSKLEYFTRQIVFIRPGTFVIFDRVKSRKAEFKKTWLLHAAKPPTGTAPNLVITHGKGRLHMQTVLPASAEIKLNQGDELYRYGGQDFPPVSWHGVEAECRIEVCPSKLAKVDYFLHVLTATDAGGEEVPQGSVAVGKDKITLTLGKTKVAFLTGKVGGTVQIKGRRISLANKIVRQ